MGKRKLSNEQIINSAKIDIHGIKGNTIVALAMKGEEPDIIADFIIDMAKDKDELKEFISEAIYRYQEGE